MLDDKEKGQLFEDGDGSGEEDGDRGLYGRPDRQLGQRFLRLSVD